MTPDQLAAAFCKIIKQRRKAMGMTQPQLAKQMRTSRENISRIENGHRHSSQVVYLARLAEALGMNLSTLLARAEKLNGFNEHDQL